MDVMDVCCTSMRNAAFNGHIDCIESLRDRNADWHSDMCVRATEAGQLETLQFLIDSGCPFDKRVCVAAAMFGHVHILNYLYEDIANSPDWDLLLDVDKCCSLAAESGNLEAYQLMTEFDGYLNDNAILTIIQNGHLHVLKYIFESFDDKMTEEMMETAAKTGNYEIVKYLHEHGCPWDEKTSRSICDCIILNELYQAYSTDEQWDCFTYIHSNGCPFHEKKMEYIRSYINDFTQESWFQLHLYKTTGVINQHTLKFHHKVKRIQNAWHKYSYHCKKTSIDYKNMMKSISDMNYLIDNNM